MEVADTIVIMNQGRIEQIGEPRELYEHPANEFVMSFLGPVNKLGDVLVRPHDIEIMPQQNGATTAATIDRITYLGFEVRVELHLGNGRHLWVQTTREEAAALQPGDVVFVRPRRTRKIAADGAGLVCEDHDGPRAAREHDETYPGDERATAPLIDEHAPWWDRRVTMEVHHD